MRAISRLAAVAVVPVLTGCAMLPDDPVASGGVNAQAIVDAVQCELASVYIRNNPGAETLDFFAARTTLTLKVTNSDSLESKITLKPVVSSGELTVPFGPNVSDTSMRSVELQFDVHMRDLKRRLAKAHGDSSAICGSQETGLPQASNELGLANWLGQVADSVGRADSASLYETTLELQFTIDRSVNGGFTFNSSHVDIDASSGKIGLLRDNHITVVLTEDKDAKTAGGKLKTSTAASLKFDRSLLLKQTLILQR